MKAPRATRGGAPDLKIVLRAIARTAAQVCEANDALILRVEDDRAAVVARHGLLTTRISAACWQVLLLICVGATLAACATGGSSGIQEHPRLRQAFFTKTEPLTGWGLREGNLPPKASQFDSTSDTEVILVIVLSGIGGATLEGTLTDARGLAKPFKRTLSDLKSPGGGGSWRCDWFRFPTAGLTFAPGEYAVDLFIDGIPSGTYKFILK